MPDTFHIEPYVGALPIRFGMKKRDVARLLGKPISTAPNYLGDSEERRDGVNIRYAKVGRGVTELSIFGASRVALHDIDLTEMPEVFTEFFKHDSAPYRWVGFILFLELGVMISDENEVPGKRVITVFSRGSLDGQMEQLIPWKDALSEPEAGAAVFILKTLAHASGSDLTAARWSSPGSGTAWRRARAE